jgi:hypothetical protein
MMAADAHRWPDDYPEGCPPTDCRNAEGLFYRLVKGDPPEASDFVRPVELPSGRSRHSPDSCSSHGLSIFEDAEDVRLAIELIPGFKKKKVAVGELKPAMGVIKRSDAPVGTVVLRSHHDWWIPVTYAGLPPFKVVTL